MGAALLQDPDHEVRSEAAQTLRKMQVQVTSQYANELAALLADQEPSVRREAVEALGSIGSVARPFAVSMAELENDPDELVRQAVHKALARVREPSPVVSR